MPGIQKFLIIDDDPDDRELFQEALKEVLPEGLCFGASNGKQAIAALDSKEIDIPDLIFLDINMPVMTGWQCLARLKETESYKHIPVIMYSTSTYHNDVERSQQEGALCFFPKPSNFQELKKRLNVVAYHINEGTLESLAESTLVFLK